MYWGLEAHPARSNVESERTRAENFRDITITVKLNPEAGTLKLLLHGFQNFVRFASIKILRGSIEPIT